jgi:hypothetical protein
MEDDAGNKRHCFGRYGQGNSGTALERPLTSPEERNKARSLPKPLQRKGLKARVKIFEVYAEKNEVVVL